MRYGSRQYDAGLAVFTATLLPSTLAALTSSWTTAGLAVVMVPSISKASAEGFGFKRGSGCDIIAALETRRKVHGHGRRLQQLGRWLQAAISDAKLVVRCTDRAMQRSICASKAAG